MCIFHLADAQQAKAFRNNNHNKGLQLEKTNPGYGQCHDGTAIIYEHKIKDKDKSGKKNLTMFAKLCHRIHAKPAGFCKARTLDLTRNGFQKDFFPERSN